MNDDEIENDVDETDKNADEIEKDGDEIANDGDEIENDDAVEVDGEKGLHDELACFKPGRLLSGPVQLGARV